MASAWICTDGVAGEAGVTRMPPVSGALLPISTIRPASAARALGSSISVAAEIVGGAGEPQSRSVGSRPSGRAREPTISIPCGSISSAPAP